MYINYIFDLYGTLVDIRTNERKSYLWKKLALYMTMQGAVYTSKELQKRYMELINCQIDEDLIKHRKFLKKVDIERGDIEILLDNILCKLYQEKGIEPISSQITDIAIIFRTLSLEHICLFDGAASLLDDLHTAGKKVYLLSNAQRIFTEPEMRMLGIYDKFDGILYSSDVGLKKPSYYFYEALFEKYNLNKIESIMIGNDGEADIIGAKRFGISSMYIHTRQSPELNVKLPDNCRRLTCIREAFRS